MSFALSFGQEIQFTNLFKTLNLNNPALSGANYMLESQVLFSNQWRNSASKFQSMAFGFHSILNQNKHHKGNFALGCNLFQDENNQKTLKITNAQLNLAYHLKLAESSQLSSAIYLGMTGINFDKNAGSWASQHDGTRYDENISSGENSIPYSQQKLDAGCGFVYTHFTQSKFKKRSNTLFQTGLSFYHLQNVRNLSEEGYFPLKSTFFGLVNFRLKDKKTIISPIFNYTRQNNFSYLQFGCKFERELKDQSKQSSSYMIEQNNAIGLGIYATKEGNVINALYFSFQHFEISFNYDVYLGKINSPFSKSAFEMGFAYRMKSFKPTLNH